MIGIIESSTTAGDSACGSLGSAVNGPQKDSGPGVGEGARSGVVGDLDRNNVEEQAETNTISSTGVVMRVEEVAKTITLGRKLGVELHDFQDLINETINVEGVQDGLR